MIATDESNEILTPVFISYQVVTDCVHWFAGSNGRAMGALAEMRGDRLPE